MPIRIRLAGAVAVVTVLLVTVGGILFIRSFRHGLETSLDPGLHAQAHALVRDVRANPTGVDLLSARTGFATDDAVAQVLDSRGEVLANTREAGVSPVLEPSAARRARAAPITAHASVGAEREPYRVLARPLGAGDRRIVVVGISLEPTEAAVSRVRDALLLGGALAVVVATAGAWFLAAAALRPVERMRRDAADISEHDRTARLNVPSTRDEVAALGATMNQLLARLQGALKREREFIADAGHELRTPLALLGTELELADARRRTREQLADSIRHAAVATKRLQHLADELLFLARDDDRDAPTSSPVPMIDVVAASLGAFRGRAAERVVTVIPTIDGEPMLTVAPASFRRVVDNLLDNALRYAPAGSTIEVRGRCDGAEVVLEVLDQGPGFPVDFLPDAFERFSRADDARARTDGGTGLGLAIVHAVAVSHGGTATAANRPGGGGAVVVRLPAPNL
jgi:two-component system, OmpR family, sensor kinase